MYEWIIVGGGVQGITLASFLLQKEKTTTEKLAIVDPHQKPLERWKHCTHNISMPYLRSPFVHHLDINPFSLQTFAKHHLYDKKTAFYGRFKRPSLDCFNEHCDKIVHDLSLMKSWIQGRVIKVSRFGKHWRVELQNQKVLIGKNLVLAIGVGEHPHWADWATQLKQQSPNSIHHIFDHKLPEFENLNQTTTIIGGGITAAHLAVKLSDKAPGKITLLKRHSFRVHSFDSEPGWLGPKNQQKFKKITNYTKRRDEIKEARHKGSIPRDVQIKLLHRIKRGELQVIDGSVSSATVRNHKIILYNQDGHELQKTDLVLLATGFESTLPGQEWLTPLVHEESLKCAECGYPIVSRSLQWGPHLYVTGSLAELEIGPIARNISGARQAAEIITNSL